MGKFVVNDDASLAIAQRLSKAGIQLAPTDARFFSAAGVLQENSGKILNAEALYRRALELLPTEQQALLGMIRIKISRGDITSSVDELNLIALRWQKLWPNVEPLLPAIANTPEGLERLRVVFSDQRQARNLLVNTLARNNETLAAAQSLLLSWHQEGKEDLSGPINQVTQRLMALGQARAAFALYRLTRTNEQANVLGIVNDADFLLEPSGNPFDWNFRQQSGMAVEHQNSDAGLVIRFLNSPIMRLRTVSQWLRLLAGTYRLVVRYEPLGLVTPSELHISVACRSDGVELADLVLDQGERGVRESEVAFSVPANGCDLQQIQLYNNQKTESWKHRYSGKLMLHRIAIERSDR